MSPEREVSSDISTRLKVVLKGLEFGDNGECWWPSSFARMTLLVDSPSPAPATVALPSFGGLNNARVENSPRYERLDGSRDESKGVLGGNSCRSLP